MANTTKSKDRYRLRLLLLLVMVVSASLLVIFIAMDRKKKKNDLALKRKMESVTKAPSRNADVNELTGRWQRTDGSYTIEIKAIDAQGNMEAAYFNPNPINISLAESYKESPLRIYVEFNDVGYEGSYYNLNYDPVENVLKGAYYQATYGQTYEVLFIRQEDPGS